MGQEHSSALSFNLEESVWLDRGETMKELLSLGLEPDIRIEEENEYVHIRGGLHLKGAYRPAEEDEATDRNELDHDVPPPYMNKNEQTNDGYAEIEHFFPVDVTIPSNRIQNLDDIYVQVDGFDYDLPEPGCIQLTADIRISGMKNESEEIQAYDPQLPEFPPFQVETKNAPEDFRVRDFPNPYDRNFAAYGYQSTPESEEGDYEEYVEEAEEEVDVQPPTQDRFVEEEIEEESPENLVEEEFGEAVEEEETTVTTFHSRSEASDRDAGETETEADEEDDPQEEEKHDRDDNASYLTKVMTKGEEEFSKLRMCIIQENESLGTIAERYETTTAHLLRFNRLESEQMEEGQILYIPNSAPGYRSNGR
ncbi:stage VI sporulation protein D [Alteribacillus sp. HJP-4]|uniref:stage VI sporulation protein D n=1 Tax=Alteribacillus sp. HJP-4 TaxID=2775394 RepID=UPI0035CD2547